jgi:predicted phosphodiesterase
LNRIAIISDVHGNLAALKAVLSDIATESCDTIVNLGDIVSGPLFPRETADLLMSLSSPTIRGNHERQLLSFSKSDMNLSDAYASDHVTQSQLAWFADLPEQLILDGGICLLHGGPGDDLAYLLEIVEPEGCRVASPLEVEQRLSGVDAAVVLCGHTHLARQMTLPDGRLVVNPGSVGLPAYKGDQPYKHKNESGSPHARYAILEKQDGRWRASFKLVSYDWLEQALLAEKRGYANWGRYLRTGLA